MPEMTNMQFVAGTLSSGMPARKNKSAVVDVLADLDGYVSPKEAHAAIGARVSVDSIRRWAHNKMIRHRWIGGRMVVFLDDVKLIVGGSKKLGRIQ